jgi:hypothetical protein
MFAAIPATWGITTARKPAMITKMLSPMDNPDDFFTIVPTDVSLITPSSLNRMTELHAI